MSTSEKWFWEQEWNSSRVGNYKIRINWAGGSAGGLLYDVGVPLTCAALIGRLPIEVRMVHVAWSGEMVMGTERVQLGIDAMENHTRLPRIGDICFDPKFQELTITYGTAEAKLPSGLNTLTVIGTLTSGIDEFARWARIRRFEGIGQIKIEPQ